MSEMSNVKNIDSTVYVFDVDGVLCDVGEDINPEVIVWVAKLLESPAFVAINTGRGYDRIREEIVALMRTRLRDQNSIQRLFIANEMGGVVTRFDDGKEVQELTEYRISKELQQRASDIFVAMGADATMMNRAFKQSMATFVKLADVSQKKFEPQKAELFRRFHEAFSDEDVTVTSTVNTVDIHARAAGKQAGAKLIMEWVKLVSDVQHDAFVCFGDSNNDYEMARYFATQDVSTTFVFTGENLSVDEHDHVKVVDTVGRYTAGTLEYLVANHESGVQA